MIVSHIDKAQGVKVEADQVKNVLKKVLIAPAEGWQGYVMRLFELGEGGYTPKHSHPWPHIGYVTGGNGLLHINGTDYEVQAGSFAYVPGDAIHQFSNQGKEPFVFICIVPEEGDK